MTSALDGKLQDRLARIVDLEPLMISTIAEGGKMRKGRMTALRSGTALVATLFGLMLFAVTPVFAGVGGAVGPTWPGTVNLGQNFSGAIDMVNASDGGNASENIDVQGIFFIPSCAAGQ